MSECEFEKSLDSEVSKIVGWLYKNLPIEYTELDNPFITFKVRNLECRFSINLNNYAVTYIPKKSKTSVVAGMFLSYSKEESETYIPICELIEDTIKKEMI